MLRPSPTQGSQDFSNVDKWTELALKGKILDTYAIAQICELARNVFLMETHVVEVSAPVTICGDIHGQFYDLLELFKVGGNIPDTNYLFLGDYVDRGKHSVQVITLLLLYKIKYPERVFLLRGNHESRNITQTFGFFDECLTKYGNADAWRAFTDLFDYLPATALVGKSIFCMHGGLAPGLETFDHIKTKVGRVQDIPPNGGLSDLLWSDPRESLHNGAKGWGTSQRGAGFYFTKDITKKFCHNNGVHLIARGHEMKMDGYDFNHDKHVCTIFSCPNYCYRFGNHASIMMVDEHMNEKIVAYMEAPREGKQLPAGQQRVPDFFL